jgi:Domain of unknown function (DUF1877)
MGMLGEYARVTAEELDRALRDPAWGLELVKGLSASAYPERWSTDGRMLDIDKAWNGIWYLITAEDGAPVDPVAGGARVNDHDLGYGPARCLTPGEVAAAASYLRATAWEQLAGHFDPVRMSRAGIYPSIIWERDGDDALDYLRDYYQRLVDFFAAASDSGDAIILWIG